MNTTPYDIFKQTGGGDAYRVAMLDHGFIEPVAPWDRRPRDKRVIQCGLTHEQDWSDWRTYVRTAPDGSWLRFEGRWCRTCGTTNVREASNPASEPVE